MNNLIIAILLTPFAVTFLFIIILTKWIIYAVPAVVLSAAREIAAQYKESRGESRRLISVASARLLLALLGGVW